MIVGSNGRKVWRCEYCTKILGDKWKYTTHVRSHTGERPFKCTYCSKTYRTKQALQSHVTANHIGLQI